MKTTLNAGPTPARTLTDQQIFDKVAKHLLDQGRASSVTDEALGGKRRTKCLYRGPGGLRCAVGALFPDNVYTPGLEGLAANSARMATALRAGGIEFTLDTADFLRQLQDAHDDYLTVSMDEWKSEMRAIANTHGLDPKEVL
jgi:hypothetical protein